MTDKLITLAHCIQTNRIDHADYAQGRKILKDIWEFTNRRLGMNAALIIGNPGTGKTSLGHSLVLDFPRRRTKTGMIIPVALLKIPYAPTIKSTLGAILAALDDPMPMKGTAEDRKYRVKVLIKQCETKVIILDEYHRLIEGATKRRINDVFEMLKDLMSTELGVVITGMPSCVDVIRDNFHIKRRLLASLNLKPFSIDTLDNSLRLKRVLGTYNEMISPHLTIPQLDSSDILIKFYCATGGLIAYISKILEFAVLEAHRNKSREIKLQDLAYARKNVVFDHKIWEPYGEPFSEEFDISRIPNYKIIAEQICVDEPQYVPRKIRKESTAKMVTK